jgi:hypothetical protein
MASIQFSDIQGKLLNQLPRASGGYVANENDFHSRERRCRRDYLHSANHFKL